MENSNDIWSFTEDNKDIKENISSNLKSFPFWDRIKDNSYKLNKKIIVKQSNSYMGLGVFASENIKKDELIECSPIIQLNWRTNYLFEPQIRSYCWINSQCECDQCKTHGYNMFIALGFGSIYNHQDNPNASISLNFKNLFFNVTSKDLIKKGSEIFINYGKYYFKHREKFTV
jgi:SET domain-containing protein